MIHVLGKHHEQLSWTNACETAQTPFLGPRDGRSVPAEAAGCLAHGPLSGLSDPAGGRVCAAP